MFTSSNLRTLTRITTRQALRRDILFRRSTSNPLTTQTQQQMKALPPGKDDDKSNELLKTMCKGAFMLVAGGAAIYAARRGRHITAPMALVVAGWATATGVRPRVWIPAVACLLVIGPLGIMMVDMESDFARQASLEAVEKVGGVSLDPRTRPRLEPVVGLHSWAGWASWLTEAGIAAQLFVLGFEQMENEEDAPMKKVEVQAELDRDWPWSPWRINSVSKRKL